MLMKPPQTVDIDRAVVHPHALQQVGGSGRSLANKHRLVKQIEDVAHIPKVLFLSSAYAVRPYGSGETAWSAIAFTQSEVVSTRVAATDTGDGQPIVAVSENSLSAFETCC